MRSRLPLAISMLALFVALGGTVYAAARINGRAVRVGSLPGNRLKRHSVAADRLKPDALAGIAPRGPLTGEEIDERSLGQVPSAAYAEAAGSAQSAVDAQTAVNSVNAIDAQTVNGHGAGCLTGTRLFAGACWQESAAGSSEATPAGTTATATAAAAACAAEGGALPDALQLAAFAQAPGVVLGADEWSGDVSLVSGLNVYAVVTVNPTGGVAAASYTEAKHYRCVIPLVV